MSLVKICGNRTPDDVLGAAEAGADFVGMIFARSERRVDAQQASAMVRALGSPLAERPLAIPPPARSHVRGEPEAWFRHGAQLIESYLESKRPLTVGVFADQGPEEVNAIAEEAGVDLVQFAGDGSWADCLLLTRQAIRVVHVPPDGPPADPMAAVEPGFAVGLMLDSAHGPYRGGSGRAFDWEVARSVSARVPIFLAGGLTPDNVGEAVATVRPWAVDVASGVEREGRRDGDLVRAFVRAARSAGAPS